MIKKAEIIYDGKEELFTYFDARNNVTINASFKKTYFPPINFPPMALTASIINLFVQAALDKQLGLHDIKGTVTYQKIKKPKPRLQSIDISLEGHNPGANEQILADMLKASIEQSPIKIAIRPEVTINVDFNWTQTTETCCQP